jgi:RNA binding exosome subunit
MIVKMLTHSHMTRSLGGISTFAMAVEFERYSGVFEELKRLFSTTPEVRKETEANEGHRGDRTLNRTRSLHDRTRPVSVQCLRVF